MSYSSLHAKAQAAFNPAPSIDEAIKVKFNVSTSIPKSTTCVGAPVFEDGEVPTALGVDRAALSAAGFKARSATRW